MSRTDRAGATAVVWGNCQAEPLARFLRAPLASAGIEVVTVPPVYLVTPADLTAAQRAVSRCSVLVTQPVRTDYRLPGMGSKDMIALAPDRAAVITVPVVYDSTEFPFQVIGHDAAGDGVFAPVTSYHDLRLVHAAERGWDTSAVLDWWPEAAGAQGIRTLAEHSQDRLRRREAGLDVTVSEAVGVPGAGFTVNHPSNRVIGHVAAGVLAALGIAGGVHTPEHEELGHTRTPLEAQVLAAHRWPAALATGWQVGGAPVSQEAVVEAHLEFYRAWPEVVIDARDRYAEELDLLGL